eukprot:TRINITY_DN39028_c0_g1_i1.p1 TRINITY_DN39028_c0_g1~~TRINITY_DN39028_c0_g1_i1.p1  ORF type:complete len:647 (+),score=134.65 TRINITY_DN39028_c0_g1_i1:120-2060(+)
MELVSLAPRDECAMHAGPPAEAMAPEEYAFQCGGALVIRNTFIHYDGVADADEFTPSRRRAHSEERARSDFYMGSNFCPQHVFGEPRLQWPLKPITRERSSIEGSPSTSSPAVADGTKSPGSTRSGSPSARTRGSSGSVEEMLLGRTELRSSDQAWMAGQPPPDEEEEEGSHQKGDERSGVLEEALLELCALAKDTCSLPDAPPPDAEKDRVIRDAISRVQAHMDSFGSPYLIVRVVWALAKLGVCNSEAKGIVISLLKRAPKRLKRWTPSEISNLMWAVARFSSCTGAEGASISRMPAVSRVLLQVIAECSRRIEKFHAQNLSNVFWAVAKLEIRGPDADQLAASCVRQIQGSMLELSPQGLANSLWAAAKSRLHYSVTIPLCVAAARMTAVDGDLLGSFQAQELSMMLWAVAKIQGRSRYEQLPSEFRAFAAAVAAEALPRLDEFAPQGLSNLAWSLATLDMLRVEEPRALLVEAIWPMATQISRYPPQAVANLAWALARLDDPATHVFFAASALDAANRINQYSWQDVAGVLTALRQAGLSRNFQEGRRLVSVAIRRASGRCGELGTQALLNILLSAVRMGIQAGDISPLAEEMAQCLEYRQEKLNHIDARQMEEVHSYCSQEREVTIHRRRGPRARWNRCRQ